MSDDPTGAAIAGQAPDALAGKGEGAWPRMAALAIWAGVLIGVGGVAFLIVQATPDVTGPIRLLSGVAFSAGLLAVIVTGAELFTGNALFALPVATGRLSLGRLAGAWTLVWFGNLAGGLAFAFLFREAGGLDGSVGEAAIRIAEEKLAKGAGATIASGVLANLLVCLAVWMALAARSLPAKAVALVGPVTVFAAAGLEHSVANMSLIPLGMMAGADGDVAALARNLLFSTAGNVVGGVAVALGLGLPHLHGED